MTKGEEAAVLKIALINMPFAAVHLPSIALTQLKSVLARQWPDRVESQIFYLNHDFAAHLGLGHYNQVASAVSSTVSGLGDWFFKETAFPITNGNGDPYVDRYLRHSKADPASVRVFVDERPRLEAFINGLIDQYELDSYDVVGFTSMFIQNLASFGMARLLKQRNPDVITVMGGANCEMSMGRVIAKNVDAIDFVFSGPSLKSFPEFVEHVLDGDTDGCHQITGVFSKRKSALAVMGGGEEIGEELDIDIDVPLDYAEYLASLDKRWTKGDVRPSLLFETSRGCWWGERSHCTFCGLNGTTIKYRSMTPQRAVKQFERIFSYSPRVTRYESVDNILPREFITDVFPNLTPPDNASIFYEVKADLKEREMEVLSRGGVKEIQPGIEALSTSTLKLMGKGTTSFQNLRFLQHCLVYDIKPVWNLLIGFPGEKEEVYAKYYDDLPLLVHLPPPLGVYPVRFDRFSPYFTKAKEYGLELKPYAFYSLIYPFDAQDLEQMAYFFEDQNYEAEYLRIVAKWLNKLQGRIDHWLLRWPNGQDGGGPVVEYQTRGDEEIVYDTRSDQPIEHQFSPSCLQTLRTLKTPMRLSRLVQKLTDRTEADLQTDLHHLKQKRLIFQENDLYMSLIVETQRDRGSI